MDRSLNIPYYFPPQRYIPRLGNSSGGSGRGAPSAAAGAFEGLSDTLRMLMELKESKDIKQERLADKRDALGEREKDRRQRDADQQERRQWHEEDVTQRYEEQGARSDEAASNRLERGGAYLMPGAMSSARTAGAAKQPISPDATDITSPEGVSAYAGGLQEGTKRGQQSLNADVLKGVEAADKTGNVQPIGPGGQYGFARKPPQDERNTIYAQQAADRSVANAIRLHDAWAARRATHVENALKKEHPVPYSEMPPDEQARYDARSQQLLQGYGKFDPEPTIPGLPTTQPRAPAPGQEQPDAARELIRNWIKSKMGGQKP